MNKRDLDKAANLAYELASLLEEFGQDEKYNQVMDIGIWAEGELGELLKLDNSNRSSVKPQFDRKRHGGLYDRGGADSYYHRPRDPHWWPEGTGKGKRIDVTSPEEVAEYNAGYDDNEKSGNKKDWG